jgi:hypothetical protein
MKKIIFLSLIISLLNGSWVINKPAEKTVLGMWTDYYLIPNTLKGQVKEVKELNYWAIEKEGKIAKGAIMTKKDLDSVGSTPNLAAFFDEKGILTKYNTLDGENATQSNIATIKNGKYERWDQKQNDKPLYYIIPEYDSKGNLGSATSYRPVADTVVNKVVLGYDTKGNYNRIEYYNSKNNKTGYHVCTVDNEGNYIEADYFNKADSLSFTLTNKFDRNGNIIMQTTLNVKTKVSGVWDCKVLKTDAKGNWIETYADIDNGKFKIFSERTFIYY